MGFWEWVGLAVGIMGTAIGVLGWLRPRRSQLAWTLSEASLGIPDSAKLTVSFDGRRLESPHLLTVRFRNNGPSDLTPSSFEGGGLTLRCLPVLEGVVDYDTPLEPAIVREPQQNLLTISPMLLKRGREVTVSAITSGPSEAVIQSRLSGFTARNGKEFGPIGEMVMWVMVMLLLLAMWGFGGWMLAKAWVDHEVVGLVVGALLWGLTALASRNVYFGLRQRLKS